MNSSLTMESRTRIICVQPDCLFRRAGLKAKHLAGFLVRILAGESLDNMVLESEQIEARLQCTDCALRVMQGQKSYRIEEEWKHLDDLGHWHHRRQRRRER
jgi:hypothetical protein